MSFNIALSGLQASSQDLSVISNNIANASTIGFKSLVQNSVTSIKPQVLVVLWVLEYRT